jgi:hypothetical protein
MASVKQFQRMEKSAANQQRVIQELNTLTKDIERCEKTIADLKSELEAINSTHKQRRTTREDIEYLTALLKCANKKLVWEKHIASMQKRLPATLEKMSALMNDPLVPPNEQLRAEMLRSLQAVQAAMERLQAVKPE